MIKALCLALSRRIIWKSNFRGPYFKDYFNQPSRAQIGTMVAILEVGAFCMHLYKYTYNSLLTCSWQSRRYHRTTTDNMVRRTHLCRRRYISNLCMGHANNDHRPCHLRCWSRSPQHDCPHLPVGDFTTSQSWKVGVYRVYWEYCRLCIERLGGLFLQFLTE
jgi:hypothetical protein